MMPSRLVLARRRRIQPKAMPRWALLGVFQGSVFQCGQLRAKAWRRSLAGRALLPCSGIARAVRRADSPWPSAALRERPLHDSRRAALYTKTAPCRKHVFARDGQERCDGERALRAPRPGRGLSAGARRSRGPREVRWVLSLGRLLRWGVTDYKRLSVMPPSVVRVCV